MFFILIPELGLFDASLGNVEFLTPNQILCFTLFRRKEKKKRDFVYLFWCIFGGVEERFFVESFLFLTFFFLLKMGFPKSPGVKLELRFWS